MRVARAQTRAWLRAYAGLWSATLVAALATALIPGAGTIVRELLSLRSNPVAAPPSSLPHALALAAHNLPVAAWPLLLGVRGAQRSAIGRRSADCLVLAVLLANVIPVGAALGADRVRLLPFLPQLPVEWAALALGTSGWMLQRRGIVRVWARAKLLLMLAALVLCAAVLEIWAVPVSRPHESTISRTRGLPDRESGSAAQAGSRVLPAWGLTEVWTLGGPEGWNSGPVRDLTHETKSCKEQSSKFCAPATKVLLSQRFSCERNARVGKVHEAAPARRNAKTPCEP
jgi:hypothetical protein